MKENFTDQQNAIAAIALGMDTKEIERTIELLQQHVGLRKEAEYKGKFYNFVAEMNEIKGYHGCYFFIPKNAWDTIPECGEENNEEGKYIMLNTSNFEVTTDNEGDTIIRAIPPVERV